jgi:hypothetical protein
MDLLHEKFAQQRAVREFLAGPLTCFTLSADKACQGDKVVYDCQGSVDGRVVAPTCGRFQEAILGKGCLLPGFEEHVMGMVPGESRRFEVVFLPGYGLDELGGKSVSFLVHMHYVMKPVVIKGYDGLKSETLHNEYAGQDLEALRQHNIHLYFKAVNGLVRRGLIPPMSDALMLVNLYLKVGFVDRAIGLAGQLPDNPVALSQVAYVFQINGQPRKALDYLDMSGQEDERSRVVRAQALFELDRLDEAEAIAGNMRPSKDVKLATLRVDLAAKLALPIETYLDREDALLDARIKETL